MRQNITVCRTSKRHPLAVDIYSSRHKSAVPCASERQHTHVIQQISNVNVYIATDCAVECIHSHNIHKVIM